MNFLEEVFFFGADGFGDGDFGADEEIASAAVEFGESFSFEANELAGLGSGGDGDAAGGRESGNFHGATEGGDEVVEFDFGLEVVAFAFEVFVRHGFGEDIEVATAAAGPFDAATRDTEFLAVGDAGGDRDFDAAGVGDHAFAVALGAGSSLASNELDGAFTVAF